VTAWGSAFVAIRAAGESLSPGAVALGRLVVSTTALSVVALARREALPPWRDLLQIAAYGSSGSASTASRSPPPSSASTQARPRC